MSTANSSYAPMPGPYSSPPITVILAIVILVFFFTGFFSIYFCRCVMENIVSTWHLRRSPSANLASVSCTTTRQGLDPSQIQAFPTFKYSTVKDLRRENYGLECAICLSEFENESMLRLLTVCYHVFHQDCIDLWLESHKTCPVCRRILDPTDESFGKASPQLENENQDPSRGNEQTQDEVRIDVRDDDEEEVDRDCDHKQDQDQEHEHEHGEEGRRKGGESSCQEGEEAGPSGVDQNEIKLSRSHTTGHSIVKRREEDRYTLRLPDRVRSRILRGHNWTGSLTTFGDITKNMASGTYGEAGFSGGDINKS